MCGFKLKRIHPSATHLNYWITHTHSKKDIWHEKRNMDRKCPLKSKIYSNLLLSVLAFIYMVCGVDQTIKFLFFVFSLGASYLWYQTVCTIHTTHRQSFILCQFICSLVSINFVDRVMSNGILCPHIIEWNLGFNQTMYDDKPNFLI